MPSHSPPRSRCCLRRAPALAQEKLRVLATFSILGDFVKNVGGDRVEVTTLVGPNSDAHVYSPSPADAKKIAAAKVVITNGLGFEGWMARLVRASGSKAAPVVATKGIKPRKQAAHGHSHGHGHDDTDPACLAVGRQRQDLRRQYPRRADRGRPGRARRPTKPTPPPISKSSTRSTRRSGKRSPAIPQDRRRIITSHDAFGYFQAAYGIEFIAPQGVSTESEASARDVGRIITQIKRQKIPAVFLENITDPRLIQRIAAESGARVGGQLYSDALTDEKGDAPTYIDMMRYNVKQLVSALTS